MATGGGGYGVSKSHSEQGEERNYDTIFKMLVIGDSSVGKTTLLTRYCEDRFQSNFMSTVGIDYKTKIITMGTERVKLQIWDTAGQERFRTLTNAYFRGAAGALLLYDITNRSSFINCSTWMESVTQHASPNIRVVIVGHKSDAEDERVVTTAEGERLADHYEAQFYEASAKIDHNVSKVFTRLAELIKQTQTSNAKKNGKNVLGDDKNLNLTSSNKKPNNSDCSC